MMLLPCLKPATKSPPSSMRSLVRSSEKDKVFNQQWLLCLEYTNTLHWMSPAQAAQHCCCELAGVCDKSKWCTSPGMMLNDMQSSRGICGRSPGKYCSDNDFQMSPWLSYP